MSGASVRPCSARVILLFISSWLLQLSRCRSLPDTAPDRATTGNEASRPEAGGGEAEGGPRRPIAHEGREVRW
eukprot:scaffold114818_cov36-Phaeocystis_antarctica.AAC.1